MAQGEGDYGREPQRRYMLKRRISWTFRRRLGIYRCLLTSKRKSSRFFECKCVWNVEHCVLGHDGEFGICSPRCIHDMESSDSIARLETFHRFTHSFYDSGNIVTLVDFDVEIVWVRMFPVFWVGCCDDDLDQDLAITIFPVSRSVS